MMLTLTSVLNLIKIYISSALHFLLRGEIGKLHNRIYYLGGPPDTSHLNIPLVSPLTFLTTRRLGEEVLETSTPDRWYVVTGGESEGTVSNINIDINTCLPLGRYL